MIMVKSACDIEHFSSLPDTGTLRMNRNIDTSLVLSPGVLDLV